MNWGKLCGNENSLVVSGVFDCQLSLSALSTEYAIRSSATFYSTRVQENFNCIVPHHGWNMFSLEGGCIYISASTTFHKVTVKSQVDIATLDRLSASAVGKA